jgi:hypothetical protein
MITRLAFIVLCSIAALGCAKARMESGTDGATHFLMECDRDADCGELSCLCGVCSKPCDGDAQCTALDDDAECSSASAMSCGEAEESCTIACTSEAACTALGAGARCEAERCVRPMVVGNDAGQGGSSGSSGSSGEGGSSGTSAGSGGSGGGDDPACGAMDARSNGDDCISTLGFAWDGERCTDVNCGCEGSECDAIYATRAACERVYAECAPPCSRMRNETTNLDCTTLTGFTWTGAECKALVCGCQGDDCELLYATQEECEAMHGMCPPITMCSRPADCAIVDDQCCRCVIPESDLVSIAIDAGEGFNARVCEPYQPCPDCAAVPPAHYYTPTCTPSTRWEGGECGMTYVDGLPCTEEIGCRVRVRQCCECGASTEIENLFAIPNDTDAEDMFCTGDELCCEGGALYPENVEARCEETQCRLYVDGELLAR